MRKNVFLAYVSTLFRVIFPVFSFTSWPFLAFTIAEPLNELTVYECFHLVRKSSAGAVP